MSEAMVSAESAAELVTPETPTPLAELGSLKDFRARREEADAPGDETPAPAIVPPEAAEKEAASEAGKALAAKKGSLQARINEITAEKHSTAAERDAAKAEAAAMRAELAALKAGKPAASAAEAKPAATSAGKPAVADFQSYDDYIEALTDWKLEQRDAAATAKAAEAKADEARTSAEKDFNTRAESWIARRDAFAETEPAFTTAAMPFLETLTAGTPMGDAIMESEAGPQVALYLAQHGEEATRIAGLAPLAQIRAIGKIEAKFDQAEPVRVKAPKVSAAPAPVQMPAASTTGDAPRPENISSLKTWRAVRAQYDDASAA